MPRKVLTSLVLGLAVVVVGASIAAPAEYAVDRQQSELVVRLSAGGIASGLAHDHVVHAADFDGVISWNPQEPEAAKVAVTADARRLTVDAEAMRARYGLEKDLGDDKRRKIQKTMVSDRQLDVERFPTISFESTGARTAGDGAIEVTGVLSLHGEQSTITFTTAPEVDGGTLRASTEIALLQTDFGIKPYSAMLGAVRNQDEFRLIVHLLAELSESPAEAPPTPEGDTDR